VSSAQGFSAKKKKKKKKKKEGEFRAGLFRSKKIFKKIKASSAPGYILSA
jgi:hypothetical protein